MALFFTGILMLVLGYVFYGRLVEKIIAPDGRETPCKTKFDGVDYVALPHWKNMLIQLLNIAGVGPVIGVIIGIKFGEIVFLIIPIGNIIAGATHDFLAGMMSLRGGGANLPVIIRENLGKTYFKFFSAFMAFLLLLVVAVFINVPAELIDKSAGQGNLFWAAVAAIFIYYVLATLFPVDKIIGKIYPIFSALLLIGTFAIFVAIVYNLFGTPDLLSESGAFKEKMWTAANSHPIIPLLFVTIACGIISGFHGTQSPIIARTMASEKQARSSFYGMMVVEGVIGMIWAAGGLAIYNLFPETMSIKATDVLIKITNHFLGEYMGAITVAGVVILAITSGDTAMRSLRLSIAEIFKIDQKPIFRRLLTTLPLMAVVAALLAWSNASAKSFNQLWNYFAWGNQVLAASTLLAGSVWLFRRGKTPLIALLPGMFMTFIVLSYIFWISPSHGGPVGFGLELENSYAIAAALTLFLAAAACIRGKKMGGISEENLR
ncbi:MAG: carbon starvation protein A [Opitutales bacterium]|nr:carbon starvation protein A [Opitutales bacterium]